MTQQANYDRTWEFVGKDQNGDEAGRGRFNNREDAVMWFRDRLSPTVSSITITMEQASGQVEHVCTIGRTESVQ